MMRFRQILLAVLIAAAAACATPPEETPVEPYCADRQAALAGGRSELVGLLAMLRNPGNPAGLDDDTARAEYIYLLKRHIQKNEFSYRIRLEIDLRSADHGRRLVPAVSKTCVMPAKNPKDLDKCLSDQKWWSSVDVDEVRACPK